MPFNQEMQRALEADAENLRQLTGEDHRVTFLDHEPRCCCGSLFEICDYPNCPCAQDEE